MASILLGSMGDPFLASATLPPRVVIIQKLKVFAQRLCGTIVWTNASKVDRAVRVPWWDAVKEVLVVACYYTLALVTPIPLGAVLVLMGRVKVWPTFL